MPLESVTINNFENNSIDDPELKLRVEKLYDSSPEFATGRDAVAFWKGLCQRWYPVIWGCSQWKTDCRDGLL